jgi:hypothetical protein
MTTDGKPFATSTGGNTKQTNQKIPRIKYCTKTPDPKNNLATQRIKIHPNDEKPHNKNGQNRLHIQSQQPLTHN